MQFAASFFRSQLARKLVAGLLAVSVVLSPASPVFAAFGTGAPTIQNPDAFTADKTAPKVDSQSGAFTQQIPLDIPPGRNGLQPDLSLQYNSQNTADGIVGYGWSLSLPYVQRLNKTGSQNLYSLTAPYFSSSLDGELANIATSTIAATTTPSIMDALPVTFRNVTSSVTSDSFPYTVPSGGSNKLLVVMICWGNPHSSVSATQNGVALTLVEKSGGNICNRASYAYLPNPTTGTFSMSWTGASVLAYSIFTVKDAAQSSPIDVDGYSTHGTNVTSDTVSVTTTQGKDLLVDLVMGGSSGTITHGASQTEHVSTTNASIGLTGGSLKAAASTAGSESLTENFSVAHQDDLLAIAIKQSTGGLALVSNGFKARVDDGNSLAYSFSNNTWTAYDKKGNRYLFGSDDTGRQYDTGTGTSTNTYKWYLQEIRDPNNNYVKYSYARDSNELYPSQILYTGNTATDGIFKITFATSTRSDVRTSYAPAFGVTTNYRVSEIDTLVNGTTVRKYLLGYGNGQNGKRSLLASLQQQGYDENNTLTSLPATTFTYASSSAQFYAPSSGTTVNGQGWAVADTNGNGINDVVDFYNAGAGNQESMLVDQTTNVNGSFSPNDYWASSASNPPPVERGTRYIDVNADGKADIVRGWQNIVTGSEQLIQTIGVNGYASTTGYAWPTSVGTSSTSTIPVFAQQNNSFILTGGIFGDVNGDGLPDFEQWVPSWLSAAAYLGNGIAWDNATTLNFSPAQAFPSTQPTVTNSQLVDVNGDGLDDWIYSDTNKTYALLNTGTGWSGSPATQWTISTSTLYKDPSTTTYYDRGIRFFDINGDGLPDFVRSYSVSATGCSDLSHGELGNYKAILLNTGNGWATSTAYTLPAYIYSALDSPCATWTTSNNEYGNWNGNGQQNQDVLTTVTNSRGGATSVIYKNSTQLSGKNPELPYSLLVATELGVYDGRGNAATTTYSYSGGKQYARLGVRDRKFAGFASTTVTAPDAITNTYFSQGMSTSTSLGEQSDGYAQINHPFRKDIFDLAGNLMQKAFYRWDAGVNGNSTFVGLGRQVQQDYAGDGTHRDSATDYLYASTTNDLVKKTEYGEVTGNDDGTFTDTGSDKRTTNITYAASSTAGFTVPTEKSVLDNNGATSSDQKLYYDGLTFGSVTAGNNTKEESWIAGLTFASSTKSFNIYGLVASSTDRRGKLTSNIFDAANLYVASSTNPLSQQTQFTYDYSVGKVKQTTDPNSRLSRTLYDGVGRIRENDQSDVTTPSTFATTTTFQYTDSATPPSSVHRVDFLTSTSTVDSYSYFDGLGRLIQDRKESQYANVFAVTDRTYNQAGELASLSLPYFSSGSANTTASTNAALFTSYTYDALQRTLTATNAVGTTANSYSKWTTTTTDADGNLKDYTRDAFSNLTTVVEHASTLLTTTYTYDAANNLATTTDSAGNVRGFTYDGLGRRLIAQDLHAPSDVTFGFWNYTYDDAGNLTSSTDPKSQVVNRTYDSLNRLLTEDYTGLTGTEVTNTYDTCTKGIGYLCTASSTSASSTTIYDPLGRAATTTITVLGIPYSTGYTYDLQSNITTLTYPNNSQVWYTFSAAGSPMRIARKAPGASTYSDFISNIDYGPHGQVVNMVFANGASTTRTYDPAAIYRLSKLQTLGASSTYFQNFGYTYDPFGNITQIANTASTSANATTVFSYDSLYRLTVASTTAASSTPYQQSFTYDGLGNILFLTQGATTTTATVPSIMDTFPVTFRNITSSVTSDSFTYTVPSGGQNKLLVVMICWGNPHSALTAKQNGVSLTMVEKSGGNICNRDTYGYLVNPSSGTFSMTWTSGSVLAYTIFTVKDAAQTSPIDVDGFATNPTNVTTDTLNLTTTQGKDLLVDLVMGGSSGTISHGASQTEHASTTVASIGLTGGSFKSGGLTAGTESLTENFSVAHQDDLLGIAVKPVPASGSSATSSVYAYAGTGFANPDAVTSIGNGLSTTTYTYDNNGNVTQSGIWTYLYDYLNRITSIGGGNSTSTFGYDATGARVFQAATTSTTTYAGKYFSVASTTLSGSSWATTTSYIWLGDTLLGTVDQQFKNGTATGTAKTRYVHPDHLNSTNVVTDEGGNLVQTLDYYPYGASRISSATSTNEKRKFIGQFTDDSSGLDYLNARYYAPDRGQFVSQDPVFWGERNRPNLRDPQELNAYAYAGNNPITRKDPEGLWALKVGGGAVVWNVAVGGGLTFGTTDDGRFTFGPYFEGGLKAGAEVSGPQLSTGNLSDRYSITTGLSASGGGGYYGIDIFKGRTYYPYSDKPSQAEQETSIGPRGGLGAGDISDFYFPIVVFGANQQRPNIAAKSLPLNWKAQSIKGYSSNMSSATGRGADIGANTSSQTLNRLVSVLQMINSVLSRLSSQSAASNNKMQ